MLYTDNKVKSCNIVVEGKVLGNVINEELAKKFIATLKPEQQMKARIVPILENNKQLLLER